MKRLTISMVALAVSLTACAGPREPLDVGVREVASDIVLGTQGRAASPVAAVAPPIPPAPVAVNIPVPTRIPAPPRFWPTAAPTPGPAPLVERCPAADPLAIPSFGASDNAGSAPVEEAFAYRNDGSFTVSGANANEGTFVDDSPRAIEKVLESDNGDFTYDLVAELAGTVTRSSYLMRNVRPVDDGLGVADQAGADQLRGLYLTRVATVLPDGGSSDFNPTPALRLLRFPVFAGDTFDEVGTDASSGITMSYTATLEALVSVDACGDPISAFRVQITNGQVASAAAAVDFSATYDIATQYGGLIVQDTVVSSGREGIGTVTRTNTATISSVPTHRSQQATT